MARILIVDDDPISARVLEGMVAEEGHAAKTAENGVQALNLYRESPFDVVITDIFMPEKEGLELVRELRAMDPDARVIAVSGGSAGGHFDSLEWVRMFGVRHVFAKPLDRKQLLAAVDELLASTQSLAD